MARVIMLPPAAAGGGGHAHSIMAYVIVAVLGAIAVYLLIRLLEWDRLNQETPNQEDPFFDEGKEP